MNDAGTEAPNGSRPKPFQIFIITILSVTIVFGGLEFAVRRIQARRLGPRAHFQAALRDRFTAWRNNPAYGRVDIQHDAQGFRRDRDVSVRKPPGTVRIFFLGGSAAYGSEGLYSEIDNRWTRLYNNQLIDHYLEERLNAEFPTRRWEVINAAANEYRLHQDLALVLSVLLRYKPDCVIFMDGHNDVSGLLSAGEIYDPYYDTPHREEFERLANPDTVAALLASLSTWLRNESQAYLALENHLRWRAQLKRRGHSSGIARAMSNPVKFEELSAAEQAQAGRALAQEDYYVHAVRQIQAVLNLDGISGIFLLQPELMFSHKPLTDSEKRMYDYHRKTSGPLFIYTYEQMYPEISRRMQEASKPYGFHYLDLTAAFDGSPEQTFTDYCHMTPMGNRLIAEKVFATFRDLFADLAARAT